MTLLPVVQLALPGATAPQTERTPAYSVAWPATYASPAHKAWINVLVILPIFLTFTLVFNLLLDQLGVKPITILYNAQMIPVLY